MSNFLITQGNSGTYVVGPYCWPYPNISGFETFPVHGRNPQILPMDYDDNPSVPWKSQQNASKKLKSYSSEMTEETRNKWAAQLKKVHQLCTEGKEAEARSWPTAEAADSALKVC